MINMADVNRHFEGVIWADKKKGEFLKENLNCWLKGMIWRSDLKGMRREAYDESSEEVNGMITTVAHK